MAKENTPNGFVLFYDYRQHLALLKDEEKGQLLMALLDYGEHGKEPELTGAALMAFSFIRAQIDRDTAKYLETCRKRREAGKRGGRPPKAEGGNENHEDEEKPKETTENQAEAKKANGYSENQTEAKEPNTNTKTNTKTNITPNGVIPLPPKGGIAPKAPEEAAEAVEPTPYKKIVGLYHEICTSYPELKYISKKRKELMDARWKEYDQNLDTFRELFEQAENSQYLKGKNKSGWSASFDWLLAEDNMPKVLEGNFADKPKSANSANNGKSYDVNDFMRAAIDKSYAQRSEEKKTSPPPTAADDPEIRERMEALRQKIG